MGCSGCNHDHGEHHHHHHEHHAENEKKLKKRFLRLCIAIGLFLIVFILDKTVELAEVNTGLPCWVLPFVLYFAVYLIQGLDILKNAASGILHGYILDENFLMAIASIGAFALGIYRGCIGMEPDGFEEGCAVVLFFCVGEAFQDWALSKSERAAKMIMETYGIEKHHHSQTKAESFISRFAQVYTPVVVILAAVIAVIPSLLGVISGSFHAEILGIPVNLAWSVWIYRALSFLVLSCPCALVISIPLAFSAAINTAGRQGVLVKSAESIEVLSRECELSVGFIDEKSDVYSITDKPDAGNAHSGNYLAIMRDTKAGIPFVKRISRCTKSVVMENIIISIGVKVVVLILSAFGISNMWIALISDEGIAVLAVLNALRIGLCKVKNIEK